MDRLNFSPTDIQFATMLDLYSVYIHRANEKKGFYEDWNGSDIQHHLARLALITSEVGEAIEALRAGNLGVLPCEKEPSITAIEEELADIIIRVLDYAGLRNLDIGRAVITKLAVNAERPHKHGKEA